MHFNQPAPRQPPVCSNQPAPRQPPVSSDSAGFAQAAGSQFKTAYNREMALYSRSRLTSGLFGPAAEVDGASKLMLPRCSSDQAKLVVRRSEGQLTKFFGLCLTFVSKSG
jgi:hypothetical protein